MQAYVCTFDSDKMPGKIEEDWSDPALCPCCNSDEVREASALEVGEQDRFNGKYAVWRCGSCSHKQVFDKDDYEQDALTCSKCRGPVFLDSYTNRRG